MVTPEKFWNGNAASFRRGWYQISYLEQKLGAQDKYVWELQIESFKKWNYLLDIGWMGPFFRGLLFLISVLFLNCAKIVS